MSVFIYVIVATIAAVVIRHLIIIRKRPQRREDLRRHVKAILDPSGCMIAYIRYGHAHHIVEHYRIKLSEVNYPGTLDDLRAEANRSLIRQQNTQLKMI